MKPEAASADLDPMFERLLDALEAAIDLASLADRNDRFSEIAAHWDTAARLTTVALAARR